MCNSQFYEQIDGVAMGSPLGPLFANLFLKDFEYKFIENVHHKLGIQLWKRYVGDMFVILKKNKVRLIT